MNIEKMVEMAQSSQAVMSRRIVRSAMTRIILVCLITSPCCFGAAYGFKDDAILSRVFGIVGVLPIIVACAMYVYFGFFKTDKLQSEDYQIRQELLQNISHKVGRIKIDSLSIERLANPDVKPTEDTEKENA
jgi:hypothetical protein